MNHLNITSLSEAQLEAFYIVSTNGSFSKAAGVLHLSQSALSRRIQSLEETLGLALFKRTPLGIELLDAGHKLLLYVKDKKTLESEAIKSICGPQDSTLSGLIRITGQSSINEPIILPALAPFLIEHPDVQIDLSVNIDSTQDNLLNYSKTDIIFSNQEKKRKDVIQVLVGEEEYVCIESSVFKTRSHVYLDGNAADTVTYSFFESQKRPPQNIFRSFLQDENGILKGVQLGLGRAIKPKHTLKGMPGVKLVKGFKPQKKPVYLRYSKKQYYSNLEKLTLEVLLREVPKLLK